MSAYALRRVVLMVPTLLGLSFIAFGLANLAPGDPAQQYLTRVLNQPASQEEIERVREELGLDRPLAVQYVDWLGDALRGDLGVSYATRRPVTTEIAHRVPYTLQLAIPAALLALVIAIPAGVVSALYRGRLPDHVMRVASLAGASLPSFWLALLLILFFAVHLSLVPVAGREGLDSYLLPTLTLALGPAAVLARFTRSTMLEALGDDYVRTARAKGLTARLVVARHALRNALIPVATDFGTRLSHLVAGAVIVETIFVWPGLGKLTLDAVTERDFPMIQGVVLFGGLTVALINLVVDLSYTLIDARVRVGTKAVAA
ncbi:MAG TPA: nickel ABC transporter permease [Acidimicrobiales bacterium]|nr:nickel ABC transporter permease [Acidimicrobiales bacterium]